jgi:16S rRNA (guanine966-N2)-methyltransferase
MRIIGGDAKGRRIHSPGKSLFRPTSNLVKEALFNILPPLEEKIFLDMFAGTGSIGIEALSRGAALAVFIEKDDRLSRFIKINVSQCGFDDRCEVLAMKTEKALNVLQNKVRSFDVLFADPPYDQGMVIETLSNLANGRLFSDSGLLIIQHSVRESTTLQVKGLTLTDNRKYGDTMLSFFIQRKG